MDIPNFYLEPANYQSDFDDLHYVRNLVFVDEQQIPVELEFDALDQQCHLFMARDMQSRPIGTARLSPEGKLGRMAVLAEWRGQGVGQSLLRAVIEKARNLNLPKITAHAQLGALGFYEKSGFIKMGEVFSEVSIPHQAVEMRLQPMEKPERPAPKPRPVTVEAVRLESMEATLAATLQLINTARRRLYLYSRDLELPLYGNKEIIEALKQFALHSHDGGVQLIIQEPVNLQTQLHPVIELAQKLSSYFLIRTPVENEDLQYLSAYVANDSDGYLFRLIGDRYEGVWSPNLPSRNRQLREEFERVWERSRPCTEFRALNL
jgi:predicted GNAT family N-acyltransferase